jgi:hypothetical protein
MKKKMIKFYDNKGATTDRYTMAVRAKGQWDLYSFSENALSPQGVNSFLGTHDTWEHRGEEVIDWDDIPDEVQKAMIMRLMPTEK